jgi:membrane fusion protein, multidrug efflux system
MTKRTRVAGLAVAVLVAVAIAWYWGSRRGQAAGAPPQKEGVPVKVAQAKVRDAPTYVSSIGTVQAFNTVTVRARVDGEISRVVYREGGKVNRGDVLVELDRRPFEAQLRSSAAQKDKDQALLENAKVDLARYEFLNETDSGPKQTLDTTRSLVHQLEAAVKADEAQIDASRLLVEFATIRSPIDGRAGARLVDVGNVVHPSDLNGLVVLTQIHPVAVSFALPQAILPVLRAQQARAALRVVALTQDASSALDEGELTLIDNQIDTTTGTIRCKATFSNAKEALWPGQFVTARALLGTIPNAVVVPAAAVQAGADGRIVYVVSGGVAKLRRVGTGQESDGEMVVTSGLSGGETVVVEGQFQLEDGARVSVK